MDTGEGIRVTMVIVDITTDHAGIVDAIDFVANAIPDSGFRSRDMPAVFRILAKKFLA